MGLNMVKMCWLLYVFVWMTEILCGPSEIQTHLHTVWNMSNMKSQISTCESKPVFAGMSEILLTYHLTSDFITYS